MTAVLTGRVVHPGDPDYTEASRGFNHFFTHRPAVVVFAGSTDDVVNTLTWARQEGLAVRVRSGGHALEGWSGVDGGVVIESRRYELNPPPPFPPLFETTGHGAWKRTGNRTFEAFFRFLLQDQASGGPLGTDNVRLSLTLDGDTLDGTFNSEVKTPDGTVVDRFDGTWHGERITV